MAPPGEYSLTIQAQWGCGQLVNVIITNLHLAFQLTKADVTVIIELIDGQGWCNNVAWNVGPLTWFQYRVAIDRHAFYKLRRFRSIIPMIQLSWNLARNCRVMSDRRLVSLLREFLAWSLDACTASLQRAAEFGKEVKWHGRVEGEPAHYCENCEVRCSYFSNVHGGPKKLHFRCTILLQPFKMTRNAFHQNVYRV